MRVALLGTGTMGRAIIEGLRARLSLVSIVAYDISSSARSPLQKEVEIAAPDKWFAGNTTPDAVIFAVKPADIAPACAEVFNFQKAASGAAPLWISIAAGVGIDSLRKVSSPEQKICRVMPNTPARIGEGMSAYSCSDTCTEKETALVETIFNACGKTVAVPEKLLHAVTGLSGSGPAFVFLFIEALIEGGVTAGLPLPVARECALQTIVGAAKMASRSEEHTGVLKTGVMSPGGTTAAGLRVLEQHAFKHAVIEAVSAATLRSAQLGT